MWGTTEGREGLGSQSVPQSRPPHLHADMETGCPGGTRQQRTVGRNNLRMGERDTQGGCGGDGGAGEKKWQKMRQRYKIDINRGPICLGWPGIALVLTLKVQQPHKNLSPDKPGQVITLDHKGENTEKGQKERGAVQDESRSGCPKSFPGRSA